MEELTFDEFCVLMGVLPGNALMKDVWDKLKATNCKIIKGVADVILVDDPLSSGEMSPGAKAWIENIIEKKV